MARTKQTARRVFGGSHSIHDDDDEVTLETLWPTKEKPAPMTYVSYDD